MSWEALISQIRNCQNCVWKDRRTQAVLFEGPLDAEVAIVGRNPGVEEDRGGRPFIGRGGNALNNFLEWVGLPRGRCFITNTGKCFGGQGDPPPPTEVLQSCVLWAYQELELLKPKVVITLGNDAYHYITKDHETSCLHVEGDLQRPNPNGPYYIAVSHPGQWLRNGSKYREIRSEIAPRVRRLLKGLGIKGMVDPETLDITEILRRSDS